MLIVRRPNNSSFAHNTIPNMMHTHSYAPVYRLHDDIDRLFDGMMRNAFENWNAGKDDVSALAPAMEISSTDNAYCMSVELPGVDPANVKLEAKENTLVLSAEKKAENTKNDEQRKYHVQERSYGTVEQTFTLPEDADVEQISANHKDGVLTICIPRKQPEEPKTRTIAITAG